MAIGPKRNLVKLCSLCALKVASQNQKYFPHGTLLPMELAGILRGITTVESLRVLLRRWKKWRYVDSFCEERPVYDGRGHLIAKRPTFAGRYYITERGNKFYQRYCKSRYFNTEEIINRMKKYVEVRAEAQQTEAD